MPIVLHVNFNCSEVHIPSDCPGHLKLTQCTLSPPSHERKETIDFYYKELIPSLSLVIISDYFFSCSLHFLNIAKVTILLLSDASAGTATFKWIFLCSTFPTRHFGSEVKCFGTGLFCLVFYKYIDKIIKVYGIQ